ncbi:MAG TPA: NAD(P)H-binding protein [Anaerolineales bacterium]|nr:NAD(P)H-binding protein [Anaerolineales bacterium]HNQ93325.1 NAD(P)H-binding protein [Anaerolineales bacterium]HNS62754.1 NAD(P)H-binding protein [Anaerolineales bacterium]
MKIAVTGAFSYTGKYVTQRLLARGEEVVTLTNHPNRPNPFNGQVKTFPLNFDEAGMTKSLQGADVLVNTYWVRFDKGNNTQPRAVENTRTLVNAAKAAGVKRIAHVSIANPSADSPLPYYWGKAANEKAVIESGIPYAIVRPTVLVGGGEDILINNIAYLLRRFPFFLVPGDGSYGIQPVHVEDVADLLVEGIYNKDSYIVDAVGSEKYTFKELIQLVGKKIGSARPLISAPPRLALLAAQFLSLFVSDVILTPEEVGGLMANLLVSKEPARGKIKFSDWLEENKNTIGTKYASEIAKHYK